MSKEAHMLANQIEKLKERVEGLEYGMTKADVRFHAMRMAVQTEPNPNDVIDRAKEIEEFLIKSGDELHYLYSTEELLRELVRRSEGLEAPSRTERYQPATEYTFAIDDDHTASLVIFDDALEILLND